MKGPLSSPSGAPSASAAAAGPARRQALTRREPGGQRVQDYVDPSRDDERVDDYPGALGGLHSPRLSRAGVRASESGRPDSNRRPSAPKADAIPGFATPR